MTGGCYGDPVSDAPKLPTVGSTLLGKYILRREIARGGMGVVFEGEHTGLHQRVAVKVLLPEVIRDHVVVERFSREARSLASVRNPHVSAVYDVDVTPTGLPFMVMEFLEGDDLSKVLSTDKTITDATKIRWICDVASALSEAHSLGIVHRDIKPANIILAKSGNQRIVKLVDFGVAKLLVEQSVELTQEAMAVGTPRYMSPEQLLALKTIDHRADIWSLGVTLYLMLAGSAPFEASDTMQLMMAIVQQPFTPLLQRRPDLPTELVELVEWTLRKSPDDRPQSMAEWAEALEPFAASRHTESRNTSLPTAVPRLTGPTQMISAAPLKSVSATQPGLQGKSRVVAGLLVAVAVAAMGVMGFMLTRRPSPAPPPQTLTEEQLRLARELVLKELDAGQPKAVDAGTGPGTSLPMAVDAGVATETEVDAGQGAAPVPDAGARTRGPTRVQPKKQSKDAGMAGVDERVLIL